MARAANSRDASPVWDIHLRASSGSAGDIAAIEAMPIDGLAAVADLLERIPEYEFAVRQGDRTARQWRGWGGRNENVARARLAHSVMTILVLVMP